MEFLEFSKKNRLDFLNILSDEKEKNMSFICYGEITNYLNNIFLKYKEHLNNIFINYLKEYNLSDSIDKYLCDFITSMEPQIEDQTYITKDEYTCHICCIEYNMIINIHKFSYEVYTINHTINELDYFHGTSLTSLLHDNLTTIEKFRSESFYDIDNFNHIDFNKDQEYLSKSMMSDIYMLTIISDVLEIKDYPEAFSKGYILNTHHILDKETYRYILTLEDAIKYKKSLIKPLLNTFFAVIIILVLAIFITVKFILD